jgi:hypothetical protein
MGNDLRPPQQVVPCVLSTSNDNSAWVHHDDPSRYDRQALAIDEALWGEAGFVQACRARLEQAYGYASPDLMAALLGAIHAEVTARAAAYAEGV